MKFGITQPFECSYLDDRQEQLLVYVPENDTHLLSDYHKLIGAGFRRSGDQVYRPHCGACQACQSIRIPVNLFKPSKSQKRILSKNADIRVSISEEDKAQYYPLYERYISQRHADGSMFPPTREQYDSFINSQWMDSLFVEMHIDNQLIGVAITDRLFNSLSAMYTFFAPELANRSIGKFAILQQIALAKDFSFDYLYLGYQIDNCTKMNYKRDFLPHERFFADKWQLITKK